MHYEGNNIIRPPSEAASIILQVTVGCSHNKCTFCGTYKGVTFRFKEPRRIEEDLTFAAQYCRRQRKVFLADGDVLIMPQKRLTGLLAEIRQALPWVNRISLYGNAKSILAKSLEQLKELKALGLDRIYMGLESGHDPTLAAIQKGADFRAMIEAGPKVRQAGLFLSVTVLLGIGGAAFSQEHARETGRVLTEIAPKQIGVLTLMLLPNTRLHQLEAEGKFHLPGKKDLLAELHTLVKHIDLERVQFQANHASNYLSINCRLKRDREHILAVIEQARVGKIGLLPEHLRAL